jgi:hypothetical protein
LFSVILVFAQHANRAGLPHPLHFFPHLLPLEPMNLWAPHRHRAREKAKPHLVSVSFICFLGFEGVAFGV